MWYAFVTFEIIQLDAKKKIGKLVQALRKNG